LRLAAIVVLYLTLENFCMPVFVGGVEFRRCVCPFHKKTGDLDADRVFGGCTQFLEAGRSRVVCRACAEPSRLDCRLDYEVHHYCTCHCGGCEPACQASRIVDPALERKKWEEQKKKNFARRWGRDPPPGHCSGLGKRPWSRYDSDDDGGGGGGKPGAVERPVTRSRTVGERLQ
jgi:hypothetical protein